MRKFIGVIVVLFIIVILITIFSFLQGFGVLHNIGSKVFIEYGRTGTFIFYTFVGGIFISISSWAVKTSWRKITLQEKLLSSNLNIEKEIKNIKVTEDSIKKDESKNSISFEETENKSTISFPVKNDESWDNLKNILIDFYQKDNFTEIISDKESSFMLGSNDKKGYVSMNLDKNIITIVSFKTLNIDTEIVKNEIEPTSIEPNKQLHEDEIYEKVMIEIEDNHKVKSTWAKALAQSAGNKDKAEALYINLRVEDILKKHNKT